MALLILAVLMLSGCRVYFEVGDYTISGRVTAVDGTVIPGVTINYQIDSRAWRKAYTKGDGTWEFRADRGDEVTIWAEQENYSFQPSPYNFLVTGNHTNVNFEVSGWYDDFSDSSSGWARDSASGYDQNEYWLEVTPPYVTRVMAPKPVPPSYSIEARMFSEYDNGYGFVFNFSGERKNEYFHIFRVKPYGDADSDYYPYYELVKATITGSTSKGLEFESEIIAGGKTWSIEENSNKLKVKQVWPKVWLFINDEEVWCGEIYPEITQSFEFGFYAYGDSYNKVFFDDLTVNGVGYKPAQLSSLALPVQKSFQDLEILR